MQNGCVLVTGGSRGIGAAMVRKFRNEGENTVFTYCFSEKEAVTLEQETGAFGIRADSACREDIEKAVSFAQEKYGFVRVLINNAARSVINLFQNVADEEWEALRKVNLDAPLYYAKAVLPEMIARKQGVILNMVSMWGEVGASCEVHYSVTKAALIGLTRSLAKEVGPSGIRVNALSPGVIDTQMNSRLSDADKKALEEETPLGRMGTPEEVAECAFFLCSPQSRFITGQVLDVNGGFVIG
ncbi:MAG: SDR family oxidoreductase [Clostridia bacterium]|nr:SDR family oxidoreductase [Clostridia bacterium]